MLSAGMKESPSTSHLGGGIGIDGGLTLFAYESHSIRGLITIYVGMSGTATGVPPAGGRTHDLSTLWRWHSIALLRAEA